ncbi:MAG TPA: ACP S-malonyltransferase, partial [Acidimicrobiaceae bacterium]|nr:ACP S-malonyltransferase [Acidimicrobiaceae bacterium]
MIVFTYSGQGSQKPGMGTPWSDHPSWELVGEASDAIGRDLAHLLLHSDAGELRDTQNAQLATFLLSMVILDAVERVGVDAAGHAGHSLGEYSALTASGALDFSDAV